MGSCCNVQAGEEGPRLGLLLAREGGRAGAMAGRGGWQRRSRSSPKRQQRWLLVMAGRNGHRQRRRPSCSLASRRTRRRAGWGIGCWRRCCRSKGSGVSAHGRKEGLSGPADRKKTSFYGEFTRDVAGETEKNGKRSNGGGFDKRNTLRWTEQRDLPCGGGG